MIIDHELIVILYKYAQKKAIKTLLSIWSSFITSRKYEHTSMSDSGIALHTLKCVNMCILLLDI